MWFNLEDLSKQQRRKIEYILGEKEVSRIKVKLLNKDCMPERTHRWDAGWDLKAVNTVVINPGCTEKINTGVILEIPPRNFGMVVPRSGLGTKFRVTLANDIGIIDSEYRGEILVFLANEGDDPYKVNAGDRFAQILIVPVNPAELWPVDNVSETGRGAGGFGSTTEKKWSENEVPMDEVTFEDTKLPDLKDIAPTEYIRLEASGKLKDYYPDATCDMKVDLCL